MADIHLYKGTVTANATDGTLVSEGTNTSCLSPGLCPAAITKEYLFSFAIRCSASFYTIGDTIIQPDGVNASRWAFALDNAGVADTFVSYGQPLTITSVIGSTNLILWCKVSVLNTDPVGNDLSTKIKITCKLSNV